MDAEACGSSDVCIPSWRIAESFSLGEKKKGMTVLGTGAEAVAAFFLLFLALLSGRRDLDAVCTRVRSEVTRKEEIAVRVGMGGACSTGLLRSLLQLPFLTQFAYCIYLCWYVYATTCKPFVPGMNVPARSGPHQVRTQVGGRG
jgi:hypothetical protein